ncbi:MAG: polysaccharide deacetylase family protein [Bacteroidales bacterium]|nr:polysaccharide deacetylase family protein [Bacteroidales bacterium]
MAESPLSLNALEYTFRHLLKVAFPQLENEPFRVEKGDGTIAVFVKEVRLVMYAMNQKEFDFFIKGQWWPFLMLDNAKRTQKIPMVFNDDGVDDGVVYSETDSSIQIPYDILTPSFVLLSRYEEFNVYALGLGDYDKHDRIPFEGTLADKYELVEIPLVDEYAMLLREWLCLYFPDRFEAIPRTPRIVPTHDIDILYRFTSRFQAMKSIFGRDLLINRSLSMVWESIKSYRNWKIRPSLDPYVEAIDEFLFQEEKRKLSSIFFFKATEKGHPNATYDVQDPILHEVIRVIMAPDYHQIGLHGSYPSANDLQCLQKEKQNLSKLCDEEIRISRQHYLRTFFADDPNSLDLWRNAGITDDYTLGFAERCGFRCGTCHPYPLYDVRNDKVTDIIEHPLIVMDGTLFDYMKLSVEDARALTQRLKQRCLDVEGDFVILWHNHATTREMKPYYEGVYLPAISV